MKRVSVPFNQRIQPKAQNAGIHSMKKSNFAPFMKKIVYILLSAAFVLQACKTPTNSEAKIPDRSVDEVTLGKLPRATFDRGQVHFSLANLDGLYRVPKDSIPWSYQLQETPDNGQIVYYFLQGTPIEMGSPHIRVEYISRNLPGCSTADSLFDWLKGMYVEGERKGKMLDNGKTVTTADNQSVDVLEIFIPQFTRVEDSATLAGKYMAWAYVPHNERFVAVNLTTTEKTKYEICLPLFKDLIRSYRKE